MLLKRVAAVIVMLAAGTASAGLAVATTSASAPTLSAAIARLQAGDAAGAAPGVAHTQEPEIPKGAGLARARQRRPAKPAQFQNPLVEPVKIIPSGVVKPRAINSAGSPAILATSLVMASWIC